MKEETAGLVASKLTWVARILGAIINKAGRKKGLGSYGSYKYYAYDYEYGKDRNS